MFVDAALTLDSHCRVGFPSGVSLSADGQILVLSHTNLHILTPALGLSLRTDRSCLHGYPANKTPDQWERDKLADLLEEGECQGLQFFKTSIDIQKPDVRWDEWSNDLRQTTSGSLDNGWRMATWSPSGLSDLGGCILATLSVNREVQIYLPHNDPVKATWNPVFDITASILDSLIDEQPDLLNIKHVGLSESDRRRKEALVLQAQATSIAWSLALPTFPNRDDSVLAVSHRSGHISFWRFDGEESMKKVAEFKAADTGALVMTWTSWLQQTDPSTGNSWFDGWLAIGCAAGQITIIRITVSADSSVSVVQQHACLPSQKSVTLLKWLKTGQLVVGRLGEVVVWSPGAELLFKLPFENYRGWPTIPSPIEVVHIPGQDRLVFSMADGTFRTIENLSTAPQVSLFAKGGSTMALTTTEEVRRGFMAVERAAAKNKATITPTTAMKLSGSPSLDEHGTVLLSYERHYLDVKTFLASTNHKQSVMLGRLAPLSAARAVEQIIPALQQEIRSLVEMHEMCGVAASSKPLFPLFLAIKRASDQDGLPKAILDCLGGVVPLSLPIPQELVTKDMLSAFLLKDRSLQILRLISLLLSFCSNNLDLGDLHSEFEHLSRQISKQIYLQTFSVLLRILEAESLAGNALHTRYQQIVNQLAVPAQQHMELDGLNAARPVEVFETEIDELDRCAACSEVIGFDKLGRATCRNGHEWLRCSVTLAVLSTSAARTCIVCSRKTRVPIASDFLVDDAETASQLLLRVSRCCLFCGGRWTRGY